MHLSRFRHLRRVLPAVIVSAVGLVPGVATAQPVDLNTTAAVATAGRNELTELVSTLEARALRERGGQRRELQYLANGIRRRLQSGDFAPGDRLVIRQIGDQLRTDTVTVGPDVAVRLPALPAISVNRVLRSELRDHLQTEISRYVRNVAVESSALLRVGVYGAVTRPGFLLVPSDGPLSDVMTAAGGALSTADVNAIRITRAGRVVHDRMSTIVALKQSLSLAALSVESGDIVEVGVAAPPADRNFYLSLIGVGVQLITTFVLLRTLP